MHWMLFKQESTGAHYLWNGVRTLCVHAESDKLPVLLDITQTETLSLNSIATTPRKKIIVFRKARYHVVAKGEFTTV